MARRSQASRGRRRVVVFLDESGGPGTEPLVFCAIAVPLTPGESYLSALRSLTEGLKSKFGVKGELSYSNLGKRREKVAQAVAEGLKRAGASVGYSSQQLTSKLRGSRRLVRGEGPTGRRGRRGRPI